MDQNNLCINKDREESQTKTDNAADKDCDHKVDKDCIFGGENDKDLDDFKNKDQQPQPPMERPFAHLRGLSSGDFLDAATTTGRSSCSVCGRSRKFYCPACCVPVPSGQPLPTVRLPFSVCVLKHPAEYHGKSTSPHAALLSPDCRIVRYPLLPDLRAGRAALVYPEPGALNVAELAAQMAAPCGVGEDGGDDMRQKRLEESMSQWTLLFVDSTWRQANGIVNDDRLRNLPRVALSNHASHYWRYEAGLTPGHLSTIEAIYYFALDLHLALRRMGYWKNSADDYDGRYDNLLLYFNHLYRLLYANYDGGRACGERKRRHFRLK